MTLKLLLLSMPLLLLFGCSSESGPEQNPTITDNEEITYNSYLTFTEQIDQTFSQINSTNKNEIFSFLDSHPEIAEWGLSSDEYSIWYKNKNGIIGVLVLEDIYDQAETKSLPAALPEKKMAVTKYSRKSKSLTNPGHYYLPGLGGSWEGANWAYFLAPFFWQETELCKLYNPLSLICENIEEIPPEFDFSTIKHLQNLYYDNIVHAMTYVQTFVNETINVDFLRSFFMTPKLSPVHLYMHSHGGLIDPHDWEPTNYIYTAEIVGKETSSETLLDLLANRLVTVKYKGKHYYAFTPSFVQHYMTSQFDYPAMKIFLRTCFSHTPQMANAFLNKGVLSYVGFNNYISREYGDKMVREFYDNLAIGHDVETAHTLMDIKFDAHNPQTHLVYNTRYNDVKYFTKVTFSDPSDFTYLISPTSQSITANYDGNRVQIKGVLIDGNAAIGIINTSPVLGQFVLEFDAQAPGEYDLDQEGSKVKAELTLYSTGEKWYASRKCLEEDPMCQCEGKIKINTYPSEHGRPVTGSFDLTLVSSQSVLITKHVEGSIVVVKNIQ